VKAQGAARAPPQLEIPICDFKLKVPDWNLKFVNSSADVINFLAIIFLLGIASPPSAAFYTIAAVWLACQTCYLPRIKFR